MKTNEVKALVLAMIGIPLPFIMLYIITGSGVFIAQGIVVCLFIGVTFPLMFIILKYLGNSPDEVKQNGPKTRTETGG